MGHRKKLTSSSIIIINLYGGGPRYLDKTQAQPDIAVRILGLIRDFD